MNPLGSLRGRMLALAALWLTLALLAAWWAIGGVLDRFVAGRFDAELSVVADTAIAGTETDDGGLLMARAPTDLRFALPLSDWFWQVEHDGAIVGRSPSLLDLRLRALDQQITGGAGRGPEGEPLRVLRRSFTLPGIDGPLAVIVTAPQADIDAAQARIRRPLAVSLAILGLGLALASMVQVAWGLRTLDVLGRDLRNIRAGKAEALPLPPVAELRPLAQELNALLEENRSVLGRAREHVGNLAHSLRTPMAAVGNTLPDDHPGKPLLARMDRQIGWHLRRARSASAPRLLGHVTPVADVVDDLLLVLRRMTGGGWDAQLHLEPGAQFAGERHDLEEMLGNLMENAVKYGKDRLCVTASVWDDWLQITVEDDGPGMADTDHMTALSRGGRLDEMGPTGAGLGLAIVADLAALHGGGLRLSGSALGGLQATLTLPAAVARATHPQASSARST